MLRIRLTHLFLNNRHFSGELFFSSSCYSFHMCSLSMTSDFSLPISARILTMLTPCLTLGLCPHCFFLCEALFLAFYLNPLCFCPACKHSYPLWPANFLLASHIVLQPMIVPWASLCLGVGLLVKTGAWLDLTLQHQSNPAFQTQGMFKSWSLNRV